MGRYDDLLYALIKRGLRQSFEKLGNREIEEEIRRYANIPYDYLDFLQEIGYGEIGEGYFMLYSGLIKPSEIFNADKADKLRDILFIGDDFNGRCIGFVIAGVWELVEVDEYQKVTFLNTSFENFIRNKIEEYFNMAYKLNR
jgi:hypothetical protein